MLGMGIMCIGRTQKCSMQNACEKCMSCLSVSLFSHPVSLSACPLPCLLTGKEKYQQWGKGTIQRGSLILSQQAYKERRQDRTPPTKSTKQRRRERDRQRRNDHREEKLERRAQ